MMETLKDFLEKQPHGYATQLCRELDLSRPLITQWATGVRKIPPQHVLPLARATGFAITPHQLSPEIYPNPNDALPAGRPGA
jgi:DNA-binding transcriptional regulator YdaS (Cro superfamily)